jgi:hypothetical protein
MTMRSVLVAAAVVAAAALTPVVTSRPVLAKDDPAVIAAARDKVRTEYKTKKWFPFSDLKFFVDSTKLKDQRWEFKDVKEPDPFDTGAGLVYSVSFPSANPNDATPPARISIQRWPHYKQDGNTRSPQQLQFKSAGMVVLISDWQEICLGFYKDFLADATEPIKDKCKPPDDRPAGPAKIHGYATATAKDGKKRERRDWYAWPTTEPPVPMTYLCEVVIADMAFADSDERMAKVSELIKSIKALKDDRLK